jgi:TIR domain
MGALLFAVAIALAIVPAGIAMGGIGVPPQQRILFASTQLILAAIAIGVAYQNRYRIWLQPIARLSRMFLTAGGTSNKNPPGQAWTEHVEAAIRNAPAFAVFIGPSGVGNWQGVEIQNITEERLTRGCNVIPVLPDSPAHVRPPMQLAGLTWVDFRKPDPDPVAELVRGIRTSPLRA